MNWLEIERKFLIQALPDNLKNYKHFEIQQWYFVLAKNIEERVRHKWNSYYYTKKIWYWEVRNEYEIKISKEKFDNLRSKTDWKRIYKTRYLIPYNNNIIELDIYKWDLKWLMVAEVEFWSSKELENFKIPQRFWEDITNNNKYKNRNLVSKIFSEI